MVLLVLGVMGWGILMSERGKRPDAQTEDHTRHARTYLFHLIKLVVSILLILLPPLSLPLLLLLLLPAQGVGGRNHLPIDGI
jgi:hypothetical protein